MSHLSSQNDTARGFLKQFVQGGSESALGGLASYDSGITGGAETEIIGGGKKSYDSLAKYSNSNYAQSKEALIRGIAYDVFTIAKMGKASAANSAPLETVIQHLKKLTPDPRRGKNVGDKIKKSSGKQKEILEVLANSINRRYKSNIIPLDASPEVMANKIAEVMNTLFTGLQTEFLTVAADVARIIRNLKLLRQFADSAYQTQIALANKTSDPSIREESGTLNQVYQAVKTETDRQIALLTNSLSAATGQMGSENLIQMLEDNSDMSGLVKDLKSSFGTVEFGTKLAQMLNGVSAVAYTSDLVNKALKTLGISVAEYKNTKSMGDLKDSIYEKITAKKPKSKELTKMMEAAEVLYRNDLNHNDIISHLNRKVGRGESGVFSDSDIHGGADEIVTAEFGNVNEYVVNEEDEDLPKYWRDRSLGQKIKKKERHTKIALRQFLSILKKKYEHIIAAAASISRHIGKDIPADDNLDRFIKLFKQIGSPNKDNLEKALSGYARNLDARAERNSYLNSYRAVIDAIQPLSKGSKGAHFKKLETNLRELIELIDEFADTFVQTLTEVQFDDPQKAREELREGISGGGGENDDLTQTTVAEIDKVKNQMEYQFKIAHVKDNLARTTQEIKSYGENYVETLGEEAGWMINRFTKTFNEEIKSVEGKSNTDLGCANATECAATKANIVRLLKAQRDAKIGLVKAAQAVDLYLKAFTDGMARNPDTANDILKLLEQVEVVAKWFNEKSGDNLAMLFESFPNNTANDDTVSNVGVKADGSAPAAFNEYYEAIKEKDVKALGNPFNDIPFKDSKRLENVYQLSIKSIKSMRALENILSIFSTVGGMHNQSLNQTFMNEGQIFNVLCQYMAVSSFAHKKIGNKGVYHGFMTQNSISSKTYNSAAHTVSDASDNIGLVSGAYSNTAGNGAGMALKISNQATSYGLSMAAIRKAGAINADKTDQKFVDHLALDTPNTAGMTDAVCDGALNFDYFKDTDLLFEMIIKSVVSKIMTVIDAYRLFHRPVGKTKAANYYASSSALRTILGGSAAPKLIVSEDALNLYVRLPLLGEWYRQTFSIDKWYNDSSVAGDGHNQDFVLTVMPSIDNVWSEFNRFIFTKTNYIANGSYSEAQVREIIGIINDIIKQYRGRNSHASWRDIIAAYVVDINRSYGFVRMQEIRTYINARENMNSASGFTGEDDTVDYDILKAKDQFGNVTAPSDKYATLTFESKDKKERRSMQHFHKSLYDLRVKMDQMMESTGDAATVNLTENIQSCLRDMGAQSSETSKYDLLLKLMQNTAKPVTISSSQYIMFHETVIAPLCVLYASFCVLLKLNSFAHGTRIAHMKKAGANLTAYGDELKKQYTNHANLAPLILEAAVKAAQSSSVIPDAGSLVYYEGSKVSNHLLRDTVSLLLDLTCVPNSLISMNPTPTCNFNIDYSKMEQLCTQLFNLVRMNINKFRTVFPGDKAMFDACESKDSVGSIMWLDEHLFESLFKNRYKAGLPMVTAFLDENFRFFADAKNDASREDGSLFNQIYPLISHDMKGANILLQSDVRFYDPTSFPFTSVRNPVADASMDSDIKKSLGSSMLDVRYSQILSIPAIRSIYDLTGKWTLSDLQEAKKESKYQTYRNPKGGQDLVYKFARTELRSISSKSGLAFVLNNILAHLLMDSLDMSSNKIYAPLIENFVNVSASSEYLYSTGLPDIAPIPAYNIDANQLATEIKHGDNSTHESLFDEMSNKDGDQKPLGFLRPNGIMCNSLMVFIRNVLNSVNSSGKKTFVFDNLAEVPEFIKDRLRTNLPLYVKLLTNITNRCEMIQKIINSDLSSQLDAAHELGENLWVVENKGGNLTQKQEPLLTKLSENQHTYLIALITRLDNLSSGLLKGIEQVQKELTDTNVAFMEVSAGFISDYKSKYGTLPFMPLSHLTSVLTINQHQNNQLLLPTESGSDEYKFNRACRTILGKDFADPSVDLVPFAKQIYNQYSSVVNASNIIPMSEYTSMCKSMIFLLRYLGTGISHSRLFANMLSKTGYNNSLSADKIKLLAKSNAFSNVQLPKFNDFTEYKEIDNATIVFPVTCYKKPNKGAASLVLYNDKNVWNKLFQVDKSISQLVKLAENKIDIERVFTNGPATAVNRDRNALRVHNILDMDIVPINVHAMMREVPFANLINYSYTYDAMMVGLLRPNSIEKVGKVSNYFSDNFLTYAVNPSQLMLKLLVDPYIPLKDGAVNINIPDREFPKDSAASIPSEYHTLYNMICRGEDDLDLERPKFLSDQLWFKVLLNTPHLYASINAGGAYPSRYAIPVPTSDADKPNLYASISALWTKINELNTNIGKINSEKSDVDKSLKEITLLQQSETKKVEGLQKNIPLLQANNEALTKALTQANENIIAINHILNAQQNKSKEDNKSIVDTVSKLQARISEQIEKNNDLLGQINNIKLSINKMRTKRAQKRAQKNDEIDGDSSDESDENFFDVLEHVDQEENKEIDVLLEQLSKSEPSPAMQTVIIPSIIPEIKQAKIDPVRVPDPVVITSIPPVANNENDNKNDNEEEEEEKEEDEALPIPIQLPDQPKLADAVIDAQKNKDTENKKSENKDTENKEPVDDAAQEANIIALQNSIASSDAPLLEGEKTKTFINYLLDHKLNKEHADVIGKMGNVMTKNGWVPDAETIDKFKKVLQNKGLDSDVYENVADGSSFIEALPYLKDALSKDTQLNVKVNQMGQTGGNERDKLPTFLLRSDLRNYDGKTHKWVHKANLNLQKAVFMAELGRMRFDTKLIRNINWLILIQRMMRLMLKTHLDWIDAPVVKGLRAINPKITEYSTDEGYNKEDYDGIHYNPLSIYTDN